MKILFRGGSVTAGYGSSRGFVEILRPSLSERYDVINESRYNETTFDANWTFEDRIRLHNPEVLVLQYAVDDAFFPVYRSEFKENLVQIVKLARKTCNSRIALLTSHPFENIYDNQTILIYYRSIREVAIDMSCVFIPVHTFWAGYIMENRVRHSALITDDTRYPNEKGHGIIAMAVRNNFKRITGETDERDY